MTFWKMSAKCRPSLRLSIRPFCWQDYFLPLWVWLSFSDVGTKAFSLPLYLVLKPVADESTFSALYNFTLWQIDGFHHSSGRPCEWAQRVSNDTAGRTVDKKWTSEKSTTYWKWLFPCKRDFLIPKSNQPNEEGWFIGCRNFDEFQEESLTFQLHIQLHQSRENHQLRQGRECV